MFILQNRRRNIRSSSVSIMVHLVQKSYKVNFNVYLFNAFVDVAAFCVSSIDLCPHGLLLLFIVSVQAKSRDKHKSYFIRTLWIHKSHSIRIFIYFVYLTYLTINWDAILKVEFWQCLVSQEWMTVTFEEVSSCSSTSVGAAGHYCSVL